MSTLLRRDIAGQITAFFERKAARHVLLWIGVFLFLFLLDKKEHGIAPSLMSVGINVVFYIIIVYFNLRYLIPHYLSQKTIWTYSGLLLLSVVIITPIKTIILYFWFNNIPDIREYVIFNQHYIFLMNFVVAASSTLVKIMIDWGRHEIDKKELETQTMQSELRFLKSQINPHFLFNTLNSLYALTLKKSDAAPEIVIKLSEMMRYMLYECNEKRVPLRKEVQYMQNYLDLESLRQGQNVEIDFKVDGQINDQQIAPLIFMPFIENSFKHGLNNQLAEGFVRIRLHVNEKNLTLGIENSKPPVKPVVNHRKPSGGIGLQNVRRRLDLIYPENYDLDISDEINQYKVNLELNLEN